MADARLCVGAGCAGCPECAPDDREEEEEEESSTAKPKRWRLHTGSCSGKSAKDVLELCARALGYAELSGMALPKKTPPRCLLYVMQSKDLQDVLDRGLPASSAVSRFPGMPDVCDKGAFTRLVANAEAQQEQKFSWWPRSYIWPEDAAQIQEAVRTRPVILKPDEASQGDGISLCLSYRDLEVKMTTRQCTAIVQRYIAKPLLLDGVKFDFRIYVLVSGVPGSEQGLAVHVCREGLARFCTERYVEPTAGNLHKVMGHLTNYSLNKRSADFQHAPAGADVHAADASSSKRLLSTALQQIASSDDRFDEASFWDGVDTLVGEVVAVMEPVLTCSWRRLAPGAKGRAFQILGFDVLLDAKLKPWLLEVNNSPSLCIDEALAVDSPPPPEPGRRGSALTRAEVGKVCRCMDLQIPHEHVRCAVDVHVKQTALGGALALVVAAIAGREAAAGWAGSFVEVEAGMTPSSARIVELWLQAGGGAKAFSSFSIRKLAAPVLATKALSTVDVDLVTQQFKKLSSLGAKDNPDLGLLAFEPLLVHLAQRARPGEPRAVALEWLLANL